MRGTVSLQCGDILQASLGNKEEALQERCFERNLRCCETVMDQYEGGWSVKQMKHKKIENSYRLQNKLIFSLCVMGGALTVVISLFAYRTTKSYLEELYAERVTTNCNAIATMLSADDVETVISEGGNQTEAYQKMCALFNTLKEEGNVTYLSLTVPDEDSVHFYIDACVPDMGDDAANQMPYGEDVLYTDAVYVEGKGQKQTELDLQKYYEIYDCFVRNKGLAVPTLTDNDYGYNYTGIAVVLDADGQAIAEVQYILDMAEIKEYLRSFLLRMLAISFVIIAVGVAAYFFFTKKTLATPITKLARFTQNITDTGVFKHQRIELKTGDEIEMLSDSVNYMLEKLEDYIENLSRVTAEKERIGAELDIATRIQASILPCIFPAFPDRKEFNIHAAMTPAKEVGGDFYDFFMIDERHLAIVVADVSGKGVPAALFMVIGKTLIKDHSQNGKELGQVFTDVNNLLCESNSEDLFITAFEGVLDLVTGEFSYVNAGHEMPFLLQGGRFDAVRIKPGFVLAGVEDMQYKAGTIMMHPGDKIFQYTDGVTEATNQNNQLFGMERLSESLNRVKDETPEEIIESVKRDIDAFVGDAPQFDDITMLCLDYRSRMVVTEDAESADAGDRA